MDKMIKGLKKVKLSKYFSIVSPKQDDKINFEISDMHDKSAVPFLGRSSIDNAVVAYVKPKPHLINKGNVITIALDGSTGATFYQYHDFCSGQNIWVLIPNPAYLQIELTAEIALYFVTTIRKAAESYTYNLSLTKTRLSNLDIYLPINDDDSIDVDYIRERMSKLRNIELLKNISSERH
jgi:hypothetical protein